MEWVRLCIEGYSANEIAGEAQPDDPDVDHQRPVFARSLGGAFNRFGMFAHCALSLTLMYFSACGAAGPSSSPSGPVLAAHRPGVSVRTPPGTVGNIENSPHRHT